MKIIKTKSIVFFKDMLKLASKPEGISHHANQKNAEALPRKNVSKPTENFRQPQAGILTAGNIMASLIHTNQMLSIMSLNVLLGRMACSAIAFSGR